MSNEADFASMLDERLSEEWTQSAIEEDAERTWPASIWAAAERDGFTSIGLAEDNGGSGGETWEMPARCFGRSGTTRPRARGPKVVCLRDTLRRIFPEPCPQE